MENITDLEKINNIISIIESATSKDLQNFITSKDLDLKQIALLNINEISSSQQAFNILNSVINQPSEIREYASFLINKLMKNNDFLIYFQKKEFMDIFEKAIVDVNPKVCRNIIEVLPLYKFSCELFKIIIQNSFSLIGILKEKNKNKNYQYNTNSFRLYWNIYTLEATLTSGLLKENEQQLTELLNMILEFKEYPLRERAAFLANKIKTLCNNNKIDIIIKKLLSDDNFYVKNAEEYFS